MTTALRLERAASQLLPPVDTRAIPPQFAREYYGVREWKILRAARATAEGAPEPAGSMTARERILFDELLAALRRARQDAGVQHGR